MRSVEVLTLSLVAVTALGCGRSPPVQLDVPEETSPIAEPRAQRQAVPETLPVDCPTAKIAFTQPTGCANDGSVEFCAPRGDAALEAKLRSVAPSIRPGSSSGRAGCDTSVESLYFFPAGSDPAVCVAYHGAMTDSAWRQICEIAALPEIRQIVPTFYE